MKVLVITSWYPHEKDNLIGIYHKEFTDALNKNGVDANLLYIDRQRITRPLKYLFMKKELVVEETNYKCYIKRMMSVSCFGFDLEMKKYLRVMERTFKKYVTINGIPDIIHAQVTLPAGYAASMIGKKYNIPVIVTEHASYFKNFFTIPKFKKYTQIVMDYAHYSTVSSYMKKEASVYRDDISIIPNLVDTETFRCNKKRKIKDTFNIVIISALREGKKIDVALDAIKILIDDGMKIKLDIIGDGLLKEYFIKYRDDANLKDYVDFKGRIKKSEISKILKDEHMLLISSQYETFGIPGVEALASGLPVVSTKCHGPEEYIDKKVGELCKINDPKDMARAIKKVYDNYDNYKVKDLNERAKLYDARKVIEDTKKIYENILKEEKKL